MCGVEDMMAEDQASAGEIVALAEQVDEQLSALGAEVRALRNRLAHASVPEPAADELSDVAEELSRLSAYVEHVLMLFQDLDKRDSAYAAFELMRSLDVSFRAIERRWADLRGAVGVVAAREIMNSSDV